jgi:antitoxin component YwqK of YwqJK toxin-antitoxin module
MKSVVLFLFLGLIGLVHGQVNQVDSKGRKQGVWEKVYPGTVVYQYRGQFKDDKPVGKFTYFYQSSKVKAVINHEVSGRSEAFYYHDNGALMSHGIFRNLQKDSIWTNFGPSGRLSNKETYFKDSLHGQKVVFFVPEDPEDRSQRVSAVMNYVNGKLQGEYVEYFNDGVVMRKGNYENGKMTGPWEEFHPNGKRSILYRYKNGVKHGYSIAYDTNMNRIGEQYFYYGRRLEGAELEDKLRRMKEAGIDPNQ